jgi:hypothetical protein
MHFYIFTVLYKYSITQNMDQHNILECLHQTIHTVSNEKMSYYINLNSKSE